MTEMKVTEARKAAAKNIKPSEVDLTKWDGKIKSGTGYGTHAKTIILNVIKVSLISNFFCFIFSFQRIARYREEYYSIVKWPVYLNLLKNPAWGHLALVNDCNSSRTYYGNKESLASLLLKHNVEI